MQWNELDYEMQMKVIERISSLLNKEKNKEVREALIAAIHELEIWSNSPCTELEENRYPMEEEGIFVATAKDPYDKPN